MQLRTLCLLAIVAVPASLSGSAASNAPTWSAPPDSGATVTCGAVVPRAFNGGRKLCSGAIVVAQTARQQCIQVCRDTYSGGGEPLNNCIRQCPAQ
jgi:hypothetical protein